MKTKDRDQQSYFAIVDSFLRQAELNQQEYHLLASELKRYLDVKFKYGGYVNPVITKFCTDWYREFYRLIGYKDPYKSLKIKSNEEAKKILPTIKVDTFLDIIKVSIKGNKLDFGAVLILHPDLNRLAEEFENISHLNLFIDDSEELEEAIKKAKNILFLTDNAGEIIFDIPLLEYLNSAKPKQNIFIAAKESPMLNDITISELKELGFEKYGQIISTGSNCFGLHEEDVSIEFKKILKEADLIIAKGQAYLEFFTEYNFENVFNIAQVKYPIINEALGILNSQQNVVINSKRYSHTGKLYNFGTLHPKIIERSEIKHLAQQLKNAGKTIVTINGSFDIMHLGHIRMLENAKKQGDVLIVGLNSDSSIKQYKSKFRPINPQQFRAEFMASLSCVDYVFIFEETTPMNFLEEIKPHIHCNGSEYGENCIEAETVKRNGGKIHIMPLVEGFSTTKLIEKVMEAKHHEEISTKMSILNEDKQKKVLLEEIASIIKKQHGIIFAKPAIVYRETYSGRDILAKNSKFELGFVDERNYVPVEWWVMSITQADNTIIKKNEGLTFLKINEKEILLTEALPYCEKELLGDYKQQWPLTKILDIGGDPVKTSFSEQMEVPPIPVHLHSGMVKDGKIQPPGKLEAYFFPPVNVPPYNKELSRTITRLGLKPETTIDQFKKGLAEFGFSDEMYSLCNIYEIKPYDGWTIPPGTIHAPGPWITFEIQKPQDDFNLASWQLGQRLSETEQEEKRQNLQLRGLNDLNQFIEQVVDWKISTNPEFKKNNYRPSKVIEEGLWGKRLQIFFDEFYGEALELQPGQTFTRNPDQRPFAGIVWSGWGEINGNLLSVNEDDHKEFLVTPNTPLKIINLGKDKLYIYTAFPHMERKILEKEEDKLKYTARRTNNKVDNSIGKKVLVTGGAGFIGSNLALELEQQGYDVTIADNLFAGDMKTLQTFKGKFTYWDCSERKEFDDKFEIIFHQAAITDPRHDNDEETYSKNIKGFMNIIELAKKNNAKLIYASSASLYGNGPAPQQEDQEKELMSAYAKSKLKMDQIAEELFNKMHIVGLRYFNVFGPRESHKGRPASMIYHLRNQMLAGKRPRLFKYGEQKRDHIYVKDIIRANLLALQAPSGVYNVGTGIGTDFNEVVRVLNKVLGTNLEIEYIDNPYDGTYQNDTQADVNKAKKWLGFTAKYSFEEGVRDYHNWLIENEKTFPANNKP